MPPLRTRTICLALYLLTQALLLINLGQPTTYVFDESHYVPAAKMMIEFAGNRNWEHPPLAKIIIGFGIWLFGDEPLGWRFMSTVFGGLTVCGVFVWALAVFRDQRIALSAALATLFNQLMFVQARVAMLDIFLVAFTIWALAAFSAALDEQRTIATRRRLMLASGILFGLATACKWISVVAWAICVGVLVARSLWPKLLWKDETGGEPLPLRITFSHLLASGVIAYFATFLWFLGMPGRTGGAFEMFWLQRDILLGHMSAGGQHYYASPWYKWPLMQRPMWFAWEHGPGYDRVVLLMGNLVICYGGLLAVAFTIWRWMKERSRTLLLCSVWFPALWLSWAVIPRKLEYLHYYLPAAVSLSLPIGYVVVLMLRSERRPLRWAAWGLAALSVVLFAAFFPYMAALPIPPGLSPR